MSLSRNYVEMGTIKRRSSDSRPPIKVWMDLGNGLAVLDREKYELSLMAENREKLIAESKVGIPNTDARKVRERTKPPFASTGANPPAKPGIVVFNGRRAWTE